MGEERFTRVNEGRNNRNEEEKMEESNAKQRSGVRKGEEKKRDGISSTHHNNVIYMNALPALSVGVGAHTFTDPFNPCAFLSKIKNSIALTVSASVTQENPC
jgi:hypothetical protein